jgi:hypothetical protein
MAPTDAAATAVTTAPTEARAAPAAATHATTAAVTTASTEVRAAPTSATHVATAPSSDVPCFGE